MKTVNFRGNSRIPDLIGVVILSYFYELVKPPMKLFFSFLYPAFSVVKSDEAGIRYSRIPALLNHSDFKQLSTNFSSQSLFSVLEVYFDGVSAGAAVIVSTFDSSPALARMK